MMVDQATQTHQWHDCSILEHMPCDHQFKNTGPDWGTLKFYVYIVGSSAGAGSGDFHVYRGVRRREYARQKFLDEKQAKVSNQSTRTFCS